ncbi:hypothetical protein BGZ67_003926 [Mortierella alpina]|nr:hypothetical protein BGZ67_003926 [Mortierella alpina]
MDNITQIAFNARQAANVLQTITTAQKSIFLNHIHAKLASAKSDILAANKIDKDLALQQVETGKLSSSLYKRLDLEGPGKFETMLQGIKDIDQLDDPAGKVQQATKLDNGLELYRVSCPVGVLLVIFEARPEVVVNIAALAIKSGNAAILKGGKESFHTCSAISKAIREAMDDAGAAAAKNAEGEDADALNLTDAVQIVESRQDIDGLLKQDKYIDMVIPRGSNALVKHIQWNTRIPVLGHADGLCSIYVAESAKLDLAKKVVVDAKTTYPAACNSTETLLVHSSHLDTDFFQQLARTLVVDHGVTLKCDPKSLANLQKESIATLFHDKADKVQASNDEDYDTEFLELTLAVKTVGSMTEAMDHINEHGSKHTDAILTENEAEAKKFMAGVDAAGVYWNASTRFADGFRYGFGAEVGVSTNKTHARGPVGLEGLVIYKYQLHGNGHASGDYGAGEGKRPYLHERIQVQDKESLGELSNKRQRLD